MATTDWRIYEMLLGSDRCRWQPGDEPKIKKAVVIDYNGHKTIIPLPPEADVEINVTNDK